jgi:hypothetical protein
MLTWLATAACLVALQESFSTTVLVFIMFQLPVVMWLTSQRRLQ